MKHLPPGYMGVPFAKFSHFNKVRNQLEFVFTDNTKTSVSLAGAIMVKTGEAYSIGVIEDKID